MEVISGLPAASSAEEPPRPKRPACKPSSPTSVGTSRRAHAVAPPPPSKAVCKRRPAGAPCQPVNEDSLVEVMDGEDDGDESEEEVEEVGRAGEGEGEASESSPMPGIPESEFGFAFGPEFLFST